MTPATGTALILLVAFVLPGFVTVLLQERTFKSRDDPTPLDRLLRAVYYSVWCYLLLTVVALVFGFDRHAAESLYRHHKDAPAELVWRGALALFAPACAVWASTLIWYESGARARLLAKLPLVNERHQVPTAWDFWFRKAFKNHVRIVYPNGKSVWGYYGEDSFASYAKDGHDLFLEAIYAERVIEESPASEDKAGPWFGRAHPNNRGGWVNIADAVCIEIYDLDHARTTEAPEPGATSAAGSGKGRSAAAEEPSAGAIPAAPAAPTGQEGLREDA